MQEQLIDIREENLRPGEAKQEILENVKNASGRVTAKLEIQDDLAADNSGSVYLAKRGKLSVLMVSKGNIFIQNALNLDPRTQLTRAEALPVDFDKQAYDIVVFDRVNPPASLPPGGYLLVDSSASQGPANMGASAERPAIIDYAKNHPVSAYVDFTDVRMAKAKYLRPKPWATTIVEASGGALAVAGANNGRRFVQLSFDILESDFPLHVGFPIFIANSIDWLVPASNTSAGASIRTGQPMYIDIPPGVDSLRVKSPNGRTQTVKVASNPVIFDDTEQCGVYEVTGKAFSREFTCNLSSTSESDTQPRDMLAVGGKKFSSAGGSVKTNRELYGFLIIIALAVLTFEWYAYHRRL